MLILTVVALHGAVCVLWRSLILVSAGFSVLCLFVVPWPSFVKMNRTTDKNNVSRFGAKTYFLVVSCELLTGGVFVHDLRHSEQVSLVVENRHTQQAVCLVSCLAIHVSVESVVLCERKRYAWVVEAV